VAGEGAARELALEVRVPIWGIGGGGAHHGGGGLMVVKQVGGGEETVASQSRGHRQGSRGWGGSTRRRSAWGGVEMVGGWLERAVRGGSIQPKRNGGSGVEEQPRAPARRSRELSALVRRSGW
jgi:hypothetical protein